MLIPRYWAKTEGAATDPSGRAYRLRLWGWSEDSRAAAFEAAKRRLADVVAHLAQGRSFDQYFYGKQPLREEILQALGEASGRSEAIITRNRYGALVLNTAQVPFVDIDVPDAGTVEKWFSFLSGRRKRGEDLVLERIRGACGRHRRDAFRLYRTKAGYRILATDVFLDPRAKNTQTFFGTFGADPAFIKLCAVQGSFRARLTPKPWRIGQSLPPGQYPREEPDVRRRFEAWLEEYEARSAGFATCRFIESIGSNAVAEEARVVVQEHDRLSRAFTDLPLA